MNAVSSPSKAFNLISVEAQHLNRGDAIYGQSNQFTRVVEKPETHGGITLIKFERHSEAGPKGRKYQVMKFIAIRSETAHLF